MATSQIVMAKGIDQVKKLIDLRDSVFYELKSGSVKLLEWLDDDLEAGRDFLWQNLVTMQQSGTTGVLKLSFFKALDKNGDCDKNKVESEITFRLNEVGSGYSLAQVQQSNNDTIKELIVHLNETNHQRFEKLFQLMLDAEKVREQEKRLEEEEEEEVNPVMGTIGALANNPQVIGALSNIVMSWIGKLVPGIVAEEATKGVIGSVPNDQQQKVNQAIDILLKHDHLLGDHLLKLANIAVTNPGQFNMLLNMLSNAN